MNGNKFGELSGSVANLWKLPKLKRLSPKNSRKKKRRKLKRKKKKKVEKKAEKKEVKEEPTAEELMAK